MWDMLKLKPPNLQTPWDFNASHEDPTSNLGVTGLFPVSRSPVALRRHGNDGGDQFSEMADADAEFAAKWSWDKDPRSAGVFRSFFNQPSGVNFYDMTEYTGIYWNYDELDGIGFRESSQYN